MNFLNLLSDKAKNLKSEKIPTIAFLGDSVTQGCFELYLTEDGRVETVFDSKHGYHHVLEDILATLYPNVPINYVYAGISGDNAKGGLARLERDVLRYQPDLTVVSFGLNDSTHGEEGLEVYRDSLRQIFERLRSAGSEIIFMTENMMNTSVNYNELRSPIADIAKNTASVQNSGMLTKYFEVAKQTASECGACICDVYSKWQHLHAHGVEVNHLLSNSINHPLRKMHYLFAYSLLDTLIG